MNYLKSKTNDELEIILGNFVNRVHPIFGEKLKKVILFGSYARGDNDNESDIDLMLMLNKDEEGLKKYNDRLTDVVVDIDLEYDVILSAILQSENKFNKYKQAMPFYSNVIKEGIILYEQ